MTLGVLVPRIVQNLSWISQTAQRCAADNADMCKTPLLPVCWPGLALKHSAGLKSCGPIMSVAGQLLVPATSRAPHLPAAACSGSHFTITWPLCCLSKKLYCTSRGSAMLLEQAEPRLNPEKAITTGPARLMSCQCGQQHCQFDQLLPAASSTHVGAGIAALSCSKLTSLRGSDILQGVPLTALPPSWLYLP